LLGRALARVFRAGAFFVVVRFFVVRFFVVRFVVRLFVRFFVPRDLFADARVFVPRFAGVRRFFVEFDDVAARLRGAAFVRVVRFLALLLVVPLRGAALARAGRFLAVDLRGPVFLAVVARFFAGAFRARAFFAGALRARDFRAGGRRRLGGCEKVPGGSDS
jgi:hypothetical protein